MSTSKEFEPSDEQKMRDLLKSLVLGKNDPDEIKFNYNRIMELFNSVVNERNTYKEVVDAIEIINKYKELKGE